MKRYRVVAAVSAMLVLTLLFTSMASGQAGMNGAGWWSAVNVQRIGDAQGPAEVIMEGYEKQGNLGGPYICGTRDLPTMGAGASFFPHWDTDPAGDNCADDPNFPAAFQGAAILSANDAIAAIVQTQNVNNGGWSPGDVPYGRAVAAYSGVSAPDMTVRFPLYKNNHVNEMTTFFIQNAGTDNTNVTATFMPCIDQGNGISCLGRAGGPYTYTYTGLEPGKMFVLDATLARNGTNQPIPAGNGSFGSLVLTSTVADIAAAVMEHHRNASPATYLKSVAGFTSAQYDDLYYVPQVKDQYPKSVAQDACNSKWSSIMVQNADNKLVNVTVYYSVNENLVNPARIGQTFDDGATIQPGETAFFMTFAQDDFEPGDLASAKVDADGLVVAMVNEETRWECKNPDLTDKAAWPGIADKFATTTVSVPFYKQEWQGKFQGMVVQNVGDDNATFTVKATVVGSQIAGVDTGDVYEFTHTDAKASGAAKTFVMPCIDVPNNLVAVTGNYHDLCDLASASLDGTYVGVIITSNQPIVAVVGEEKGWWIPASRVGDGHSEDAAIFTGIGLD